MKINTLVIGEESIIDIIANELKPGRPRRIRGIKLKIRRHGFGLWAVTMGKPKTEDIMKLTQSGLELKEVIEKAISDHVITNSEYVEIMKVASNDGITDDHEQRLLSQLQELLENGTLKRIKG